MMTDVLRLVLYGLTSLAIGFAVVVVSASGFLFRDPALYGILDGQYGVLFLPMVTATILVGFAYSALGSRFGRRKLCLSGFVFLMLYLSLVLVASLLDRRPGAVFGCLLIAQTFQGIGFALLMTSISVFSIELFPRHRTSVLTAIHALFGVGAFLSPLALTAWHASGRWTGVIAQGIAQLALVFLAALFGRSTPPDPVEAGDTTPADPFKAFRRLPGHVQGYAGALVLYGIIEAVVANWSTIYLTRERGYSAATAAICLSLFWGFLTLGRLTATFASVWIDARKLFRAAPFIALAGFLMLKGVQSEAGIYLPYMVIGFGCSYTFPVSVSLSTRYHDAQRSVLPSFMLTGLMLGIGIGSSSIGFLRGAGWMTLEQAFSAGALAAAMLCALFFILTRRPFPGV